MANAVASVCLAPIAWCPGWLSSTIIGATTGLLMLLVFKYKSNQTAIKSTRNQIKANLLALSLFKDHISFSLLAQGRLLANAMRLLLLALLPMAVMTLPLMILLGQLGLRYQSRPLRIGEAAVVTAELNANSGDALYRTHIEPLVVIEQTIGPVHIPSKNLICWTVTPTADGLHQLTIHIDGNNFVKELAVGTGYMPVSLKRPFCTTTEMLTHPREEPFDGDSVVRSIEITYPDRDSWTAGTDHWLVYWFASSMIAAFAIRPFLNVNL